MNRVTSTIGWPQFAALAIASLIISGCGPTVAPPKKDPEPQTRVEPPALNQVEKKGEPKPAPPEEKPALPPPMLVAPAGPAEPGVNAKQGAAIPISFDDLALSLPMGKAFEESLLTPCAKELVGKQVAIRGYIYSELTTSTLTRFPFLRNPECPFGPGANAEHVIDVQMEGTSNTQYTTQSVTVIGTLTAEPYIGDDGTAWAIFRIVARRVQLAAVG